jgi:hypothetical protein
LIEADTNPVQMIKKTIELEVCQQLFRKMNVEGNEARNEYSMRSSPPKPKEHSKSLSSAPQREPVDDFFTPLSINEARRQSTFCINFIMGNCRVKKCNLDHRSLTSIKLCECCKYNLFGICKFPNRCRSSHEECDCQ